MPQVPFVILGSIFLQAPEELLLEGRLPVVLLLIQGADNSELCRQRGGSGFGGARTLAPPKPTGSWGEVRAVLVQGSQPRQSAGRAPRPTDQRAFRRAAPGRLVLGYGTEGSLAPRFMGSHLDI